MEDHKFVSPDSSITIEDARSSLTKAKARHERSFFEMSRGIDFDLKAYIQDCIPIHNISLPMVCVITNHLGVTR